MSTAKTNTSAALQTATPESVREVNRVILLRLMRRYQPVSRADLARRSGIVQSSVSRIVEQLIGEGVLAEERGVPVSRGKVPMLLRLRDDYFQVLGIHIQPLQTTVAFAGFNGNIHNTWSFPTPQSPRKFIDESCKVIREIQRSVDLAPGGIRHIGVGVPGFIDCGAGKITAVSSLPEYSAFPLAAEFQAQAGIPVSIDNDCNLGALSELRRAEGREEGCERDFIFVSVGDYGVGAGLVLGGELYRGHDLRFAAEVGHMIMNVDGPKCSCGRHGCLETYISNSATFSRYKPRTLFRRDRFAEMLRAAADGEPRAVKAVEETACHIALAVSNIASVLNPAEIVIAGEITEAFPMISDALESRFQSPYASARIRRSWWPREAPLLHGAVWLAIDQAVTTPVFGVLPDSGVIAGDQTHAPAKPAHQGLN
ncbi:MAG: ROK family transcriptional regulator [Bryobacteraceae bacterium]